MFFSVILSTYCYKNSKYCNFAVPRSRSRPWTTCITHTVDTHSVCLIWGRSPLSQSQQQPSGCPSPCIQAALPYVSATVPYASASPSSPFSFKHQSKNGQLSVSCWGLESSDIRNGRLEVDVWSVGGFPAQIQSIIRNMFKFLKLPPRKQEKYVPPRKQEMSVLPRKQMSVPPRKQEMFVPPRSMDTAGGQSFTKPIFNDCDSLCWLQQRKW